MNDKTAAMFMNAAERAFALRLEQNALTLPEPVFSDAFEHKMDKLCRKVSKETGRRSPVKIRFWLIAAVVAALIIAAAAVTIAKRTSVVISPDSTDEEISSELRNLNAEELIAYANSYSDSFENEGIFFTLFARLEETFDELTNEAIERIISDKNTSNTVRSVLLEMSEGKRELDYRKLSFLLNAEYADTHVKRTYLMNLVNGNCCEDIVESAMDNDDPLVAADAIRHLGRGGNEKACSYAKELIAEFVDSFTPQIRAAFDVYSARVAAGDSAFTLDEFIGYCDKAQLCDTLTQSEKDFAGLDLVYTNIPSAIEHVLESPIYGEFSKEIARMFLSDLSEIQSEAQ